MTWWMMSTHWDYGKIDTYYSCNKCTSLLDLAFFTADILACSSKKSSDESQCFRNVPKAIKVLHYRIQIYKNGNIVLQRLQVI